MSTTERSSDNGAFRSRILAQIGLRKPDRAPIDDLIPSDARERARILFDRLAEERERGRGNVYQVSDEQSRVWEVEHRTEAVGSVNFSFFRLKRSSTDKRGWMLHTNPDIRTAEALTIYPWFVVYSDYISSFKYLSLNSSKTLYAAEKIITSLFPVNDSLIHS